MIAILADGWTVYAVEQDAQSVPYDTVRVSPAALERTAIVVGNAVEGLPVDVCDAASGMLEIPIRGAKESLNVSVAFGIVAFAPVRGVLPQSE